MKHHRPTSGVHARNPSPLAYVLPLFDPSTDQHYAHIPNLLMHLGARTRVAVVVERSVAQPALPGVEQVIALGDGNASAIARIPRLIGAVAKLRDLGFRVYVVRYSRLTVTLLLLLRARWGLTVAYWASGEPDADPRDFGGKRSTLQDVAAKIKVLHTRWLLARVDIFLTGPETMVDYFVERWGVDRAHVKLLYNDVDTERFHPATGTERATLRKELGWADDEFVVLFVHRLAPRKGSRLLPALAELLHARLGETFRLMIVGAGPDEVHLDQVFERSTARARVVLRGAVPNLQLAPLYSAADCFLMPSFEEGFPRVLLEAMAGGCPVVGTRAGGSADILGNDYPLLAEVGDVEALADHVVLLYEDEGLRTELGSRLRDRVVARYSTERVASMLVEQLR